VSESEGEALAKELGAIFLETSAKEDLNQNIHRLFLRSTKKALFNQTLSKAIPLTNFPESCQCCLL